MEIVLIFLLIGLYILEYFERKRLNKRIDEINSKKCHKKCEEKPKKVEISKEDKKKQEKIRKNFENLMNYDYDEALKSSKGE